MKSLEFYYKNNHKKEEKKYYFMVFPREHLCFGKVFVGITLQHSLHVVIYPILYYIPLKNKKIINEFVFGVSFGVAFYLFYLFILPMMSQIISNNFRHSLCIC